MNWLMDAWDRLVETPAGLLLAVVLAEALVILFVCLMARAI